MLFGRRKPGFVQVEGLTEDQIKEACEGAVPPQAGEAGSLTGAKKGLLEYISALPDVEDPCSQTEEGEERTLTPAQKLAEYIRMRSAASQLTARHALETEIEDYGERLVQMEEDESCGDIAFTEGAKDIYFYSKENMSDNYAMIAALVEEKDLPSTIAKMVRFNCKTYPLPTPIHYFERHPYFATIPQLLRAADMMTGLEEFKDIKVFQNSERVTYFYSDESMTERYAKALAEPDEFTD